MLATIHTMFVNKKIKRIYSFCPYSTWNTRQMHFKRSIVTKQSPPPHDPLKYLTVGGFVYLFHVFIKFWKYPYFALFIKFTFLDENFFFFHFLGSVLEVMYSVLHVPYFMCVLHALYLICTWFTEFCVLYFMCLIDGLYTVLYVLYLRFPMIGREWSVPSQKLKDMLSPSFINIIRFKHI